MIYTNDHLPAHVHAIGPGKEARFLIEPVVVIDESAGFSRAELRRIAEHIEDNLDLLRQHWNSIHGGQSGN